MSKLSTILAETVARANSSSFIGTDRDRTMSGLLDVRRPRPGASEAAHLPSRPAAPAPARELALA